MNSLDKKVITLYNELDKSTYEIAKMLNTYPNKIRRILKKHGYELKDKSQAQKIALETGRSKHPTKGKERDEATRVKISSKLVKSWENIDDETREQRAKAAKDRWAKIPNKKKQEMIAKSHQAIRASAKEGSKLEKFIVEKISNAGYSTKMHEKIISAENLEIDIYIPKLKVIIEVDGPSHFYPIWGEERLQKQINADARKSGVLLSKGFVIIRIKSEGEESLAEKTRISNIILEKLSSIEYNFPVRSKRFIEVE